MATDYSTIFSDALAVGAEAAEGVAAREFDYYVGSQSVPLDAIKGRSEFESLEEEGAFKQSAESTDFLIDPALLVFNGERIEPAQGHKIREVCEQTGWVYWYTVGSPFGTDRPWRWTDGSHTRLRVHTILDRVDK